MVFSKRPFIDLLQTIQYCLVRFIIWFIRSAPYRPSLILFRSLCILAWLLDPFHRKTTDIQMKSTLDKSYKPFLSLKVFMNHGDILVDTIRYAYMDDKGIRDMVSIEGGEHLDNALKQNKGIMISTSHIGNWEILSHIPRILGIQFCVMANKRRNPYLEAIVDDIRSRSGATILPPKGKALMLIRQLKKGAVIGMVIDQRGKRSDRLFCNMFGLPAPTNPAPAFIAIKGDALVLPVYAIKIQGRYIIRFSKPVDASSFGRGKKGIQALSDYMQSWVESVVRLYPDQWSWLNCRWTKRSEMRSILRAGMDFDKFVLSQTDSQQLDR